MSLGGLIKNKDLWRKYVAICKRNNRTVTDDLEAFIAETVKNHETGNDQFKITQWVDNFDMKAVPAFNSKQETWKNYVENTSTQNFDEIKLKHEQLGGIFSKVKKEQPKTGLTLRQWFDSCDELLTYYITRQEREKGINAITKKTKHANNTKH